MLPLEQIILLCLAIVVCEILGTIVGFGSSVFYVPLLTLWLPTQTVLGITSFLHVISNFNRINLFRKKIDLSLVLWFGLPSLLFVALGSFLTKYISTDFFKISLAIIMLLTVASETLFHNIHLPKSKLLAIIGGSLAGLFVGLVGTGGAIRGTFLLSFDLGRGSFVSTSAAIDMFGDLMRLLIYIYNGFISVEIWRIVPFLFLSSFIGTQIGKKILGKIPPQTFRFLAMCCLALLSFGLILEVILQ